jgi:cephalosporin hydroxylase
MPDCLCPDGGVFISRVTLWLRDLAFVLLHRLYISDSREQDIVDQFNQLYYDSRFFGRGWSDTSWLGIPVAKSPTDLWVYQEIITELRPDIIIESGTGSGGSALFLASICDLIDKGQVITIDVNAHFQKPTHERITYLFGSSTSEEIVRRVADLVHGHGKVMVILDSDHRRDHVLDEMKIYGEFVTRGAYLIVEDTNINGHPVAPAFGPGPMEAVEEFLKGNASFVIDKSKEKFYLTFNPNGYLRRIK